MNRRTMLATLASAALLPTTRLFADGKPKFPGHSACENNLRKTIIALETLSWHSTLEKNTLKIMQELLSDDFFEVLADGSVWPRKMVIDYVKLGLFKMEKFTLSEVDVISITETAALIHYRIDTDYWWAGVFYPDNQLRATSSYAKICGQWKACSYHECVIL